MKNIFTIISATMAFASCGKFLNKEKEETISQSCQSKLTTKTEDRFSLVNGKESSEHPAVVLIVQQKSTGVGVCTGTFVSSSTLITAAHCINSQPNGGIYYFPGSKPNLQAPTSPAIKATKAFHLGKTIEYFEGLNGNIQPALDDLAIVVFPEGTAPAAVGLVGAKPPLEETVTMIGFGSTHVVGSPNLSNYTIARRIGTNKIKLAPNFQDFHPEQILVGYISEQASQNANGALSLASNGDSGGPILAGGLIAGIASTASFYPTTPALHFASYNSVNGPEAIQLIAQARQGGASIPEFGEVVDLKNPNTLPSETSTPVNCQ
jgi:Trypsin